MEKEHYTVEGLAEFVAQYKIKIRIVNNEEYLVMYKAVCPDFGSWYRKHYLRQRGDIGAYRPGTIVNCRTWSPVRSNSCGAGLHVGTWTFIKYFARHNIHGDLVFVEVLVCPKDVVCVPHTNDGKIRCKRLTVVRTVDKRKKPS